MPKYLSYNENEGGGFHISGLKSNPTLHGTI